MHIRSLANAENQPDRSKFFIPRKISTWGGPKRWIPALDNDLSKISLPP